MYELTAEFIPSYNLYPHNVCGIAHADGGTRATCVIAHADER